LLEGFTTAALKYYFKFKDQARATGMHRLLLGIIYQTHIQLVHNRKLGLITAEERSKLRTMLLDPQVTRDLGMFKRLLLAVSGAYNALPIRIPGVNLVLYRMITA
jgi:hypothetical protein